MLGTGRELGIDAGYDAIRMQKPEELQPVFEVLGEVGHRWNDLIRGDSSPVSPGEHVLATRYIGELQSYYHCASHRGHGMVVACT